MKIEIVKTTNKNKPAWFFRMKAKNGRILCHSEIYASRRAALKTSTKILYDCSQKNCPIVQL